MVRRKPTQISFSFQIMMWFAGLRGAIALSLTGALNPYFGDDINEQMQMATCVVIFLTLIIYGCCE